MTKPTIADVLWLLNDELYWKRQCVALESDEPMVEAYNHDIACLELAIDLIEKMEDL